MINLGNCSLVLNGDKTFVIKTDSAKDLKITGEWDLCCKGSDYGNYVFRFGNLQELKSNLPNLYVVINNKVVKLFFGDCK